MIDADAALDHHLFRIAQAEVVSQVPAYAQQDHRAIEMETFEYGGFLKW